MQPAGPDRVARQPAGPDRDPTPPAAVGDPSDNPGGSAPLPLEARPPWPVLPAPFSPGTGPGFAPDGEPYEPADLAERPPLESEPLKAAPPPDRVETQPRAMVRDAPLREPAETPPEAAETADLTPAIDERVAGTEAAGEHEGDDGKKDENFDRVTVYYGTDRANLSEIERNQREYLIWLKWAGVALIGTFGLAVANLRFRRGKLLKFLFLVSLFSTVGLAGWSAVCWLQAIPPELQPQFAYGGKRGNLKYGTSDVSIPRNHQRGKLESPSLVWGEFRANPEKHVKVLDAVELSEAAFYDQLRDCVADSRKKQTFVFIHGYNVSFDDAIRRTAQLAFDLKFDGAPVCYSWPSQANTFRYASDEETVLWTEDHLEEFLTGIRKKSGAERIHLIAHSMGNRALTAVLRRMARDLEDDDPPFDEVVLTAPDIDADTYRRRAPDVAKMARRVTLYASSNDEALAMSKEYHGGIPRAGESGENIVVLPGIDTIDVSSIDTSLFGHTYYGDNTSVLADLFHLIQFGRPAEDRAWLKPEPFEDLRYWIFLTERIGERRASDKTR
jgi:esterase/lipase superfamily enzyme